MVAIEDLVNFVALDMQAIIRGDQCRRSIRPSFRIAAMGKEAALRNEALALPSQTAAAEEEHLVAQKLDLS